MKITELLTESEIQEMQHLEEGPLGALGTGVGKLAGGVAHGVGAVAGGVAGMGRAFKKGYATGKATVAGDADPYPDAADAEQPADAAQGAANGQGQGGAGGAAGPNGTGNSMGGNGGNPTPTNVNVNTTQNAAPGNTTAPAADPAKAAAEEKQAKVTVGQINKLLPQLRTRDLNSVKKNLDAVMAKKAQTDKAAKPAPDAAAGDAGAGAFGSMANTLQGKEPNTMANAPVSKTNTAPAADAAPAPEAPPATTAAPADAATTTAPAGEPVTKPKRTRNKKTAAAPAPQASQAEIDAERDRLLPQANDSIIRVGTNLSEKLASKIHSSKQRMVAEGVRNGTFSIFRKY